MRYTRCHLSAQRRKRSNMKRINFFIGLILLTLTACSTQTQTTITSTAECEPTLVIDSTIFQMETIHIASDGSLPVLADDPKRAYWVDGTDNVFIFIIKSTPENLALASTITPESIAKATWSNCVSITYTLSAPEPGSFGITYLPDQTTSSAQFFMQSDSSENNIVINGAELEE